MTWRERDGWVCQLCDLPVDPATPTLDPLGATLDHIHPVSRGGPHVESNLQLAHRGCNSRKQDRIAA